MERRTPGRALVVLLLASLSLVLVVSGAGCNRQGEGEGNPRRDDTQKDSPTTGQMPPSTGVPEESTTSAVAPADGRTEGGARTDTSVPGAQPGRPQLDAEPTAEPES